MVELGISIHSAKSCIVAPIKHLEQVVHNRENSSPNKIKVEPNGIFGVQALGLMWLVVVVALLDRVVAALQHKSLAQISFQALLTFLRRLSS